MARDSDDREGESPSPMEPRPGRTFHSSATGRRREQTLPEAPGLRQGLHPRDDTAGNAGSKARTTRSAAAHRTSIASHARMRDPNRQGPRTRRRATVPERAPTQDPQAPPTAGSGRRLRAVPAPRLAPGRRGRGCQYAADRRGRLRRDAYALAHRQPLSQRRELGDDLLFGLGKIHPLDDALRRWLADHPAGAATLAHSPLGPLAITHRTGPLATATGHVLARPAQSGYGPGWERAVPVPNRVA